MATSESKKQFADSFPDTISELEILRHTNQLLEAENFVLVQYIHILKEYIQALNKFRDHLEQLKKIAVLLKYYVNENGLGEEENVNNLIAYWEKLLSEWSLLLGDLEKQ